MFPVLYVPCDKDENIDQCGAISANEWRPFTVNPKTSTLLFSKKQREEQMEGLRRLDRKKLWKNLSRLTLVGL